MLLLDLLNAEAVASRTRLVSGTILEIEKRYDMDKYRHLCSLIAYTRSLDDERRESTLLPANSTSVHQSQQYTMIS